MKALHHRLVFNAYGRELLNGLICIEKSVGLVQIVLAGGRRSEQTQRQVGGAVERLLEKGAHKVDDLCLRRLIEPLAVYLDHNVRIVLKGQLAEVGVFLEVQGDLDALGILGAAPAELRGE